MQYYLYDFFAKKKHIIYKILLIIGTTLIGIISLWNKEELGLFLFGSFFFHIGLYISMDAKYSGIIFLFSHGGIGFYCMLNSLSLGILSNPILKDGNPKKLIIYLGVIGILTVIGFISAIIYNVSDKVKEKNYTMHLPTCILSLALILTAILPKILDKLV